LRLIEAELIDAAILEVNLGGQRSYPVARALMEKSIPERQMTYEH
jgi:hypothetical protein